MKNMISAFLLLTLPLLAMSQENPTPKELGDKAYAESRYKDAVAIYERLWRLMAHRLHYITTSPMPTTAQTSPEKQSLTMSVH